MLSAKRALALIQSGQRSHDDWHAKVNTLRGVTLGDPSALNGWSSNDDQNQSEHRKFRNRYPLIMVRDIKAGRNNDLLKYERVLVKGATYSDAQIESKRLVPKRKAIVAQYCVDRMDRCNGFDHVNMCLWDFTMGGAGVAYISQARGYPTFKYVDTLDFMWDPTAEIMADMQWASCSINGTLEYWYNILTSKGKDKVPESFVPYLPGGKFFKQPKAKNGNFQENELAWDLPFEVQAFYHNDDEEGTYMLFAKTDDDAWDPEPLYEGPNPNYFTENGEKQRYLPFETMHFDSIPGMRFPVGVTESMLPAQMELWGALDFIQRRIKNGVPWYEALTDVFSTETQKIGFLEAVQEGVVTVKELGKILPHGSDFGEIPEIIMEIVRESKSQLQSQSGNTAASVGEKTQGVQRATEYKDIMAKGDLTSGTISKALAGFTERGMTKFIGKGRLIDKKPLSVWIDKREIVLDEKDPVAGYLPEKPQLTISEDSMRYASKAQKLQEAQQLLQIAMSVAQIAGPQGVLKAYRNLLEEAGVDDPDSWITDMAAMQQQQQAQQQGQPGAGMQAQPGQSELATTG